MKHILLISLLLINVFIFSQNNKDSVFVFNVAEEKPEFVGGSDMLLDYLAKNTKYPQEALQNYIEGKVFVKFVVNKDSSISNVSVVKSAHPLIDKEAVRVVENMPKWKPGKKDGNIIRVSTIVPINFAIPLGSPNRSKPFIKGLKEFKNENYKAAVKKFDKALELNPKDKKAYFYRAKSKIKLGLNTGACRDYKSAMELGEIGAGQEYRKYCKLKNDNISM